VNKNWSIDVRVNCKLSNNLVKFIIFELDSSQKLIEFEELWDDFKSWMEKCASMPILIYHPNGSLCHEVLLYT